MTPVSHAILPLLAGKRWIPANDSGRPCLRISFAVAFAGVLPDILCPHLALNERLTAYSHSLIAWLVVCFSTLAACAHPKVSPHKQTAVLCVAAYALHLACDSITGGIPLLAPFSDKVAGGSYLPFWTWLILDALLLAYAYMLYRWLPLRRKLSGRRLHHNS